MQRAAIVYDDITFSPGFPVSILFVDAYELGGLGTIHVGQRYEWTTDSPPAIALAGGRITTVGEKPPLFGADR